MTNETMKVGQGKHTKGPWTVQRFKRIDNTKGICITAFPIPVIIAKAICFDSKTVRPEESNANARLIAAAPELLEAVQSARNAWINNNGQLDKDSAELILNAIAKAEGR